MNEMKYAAALGLGLISGIGGLESYAQDSPKAPSLDDFFPALAPDAPVNDLERRAREEDAKNKAYAAKSAKQGFIFIPGETRELDEIRMYNEKLTKLDGEGRKDTLDKTKDDEDIRYNFQKGYVVIGPGSKTLDFDEFKEGLVLTEIYEDEKITDLEREFAKKHAPKLYAEHPIIFGDYELQNKDEESKENEKDASPSIFNQFLIGIMKSYAEKKAEDQFDSDRIGRNMFDLTDKLFGGAFSSSEKDNLNDKDK